MNKKILILIGLLIIISLLGSFYYQRFAKERAVKGAQKKTEQLRTQTVAVKEETKIAENRSYQGKNFTVEYDGGSRSYYITIRANTLNEFRLTKQEAEQYLKDGGIKDLCAISLYFAPPVNLKNQISHADLFATNCAALF